MGKVEIGIYCYLTADILTKVLQKCSLSSPLPIQARTQGVGVLSVRTHSLAEQIISKSCSFSPETEFTTLIVASKSEFSLVSHTALKKS